VNIGSMLTRKLSCIRQYAWKTYVFNLAYLNQGRKGTHLEPENHDAYSQQHLQLLRDLLAEAQQ
jgi:hypothetical protein